MVRHGEAIATGATMLFHFKASRGCCWIARLATSVERAPNTSSRESLATNPAGSVFDGINNKVAVINDREGSFTFTYTGSTRPIPQFKKEAIRQWARLYAGSIEHYTEPYQSEMLSSRMACGIGWPSKRILFFQRESLRKVKCWIFI